MAKRNLSDVLLSRVQDMKGKREGKVALRSATVDNKMAPQLTAEELVRLRRRLDVSTAVFSRYLRTSVRTVEGWEQGKTKPNAQAALLIKLIEKYPETVAQLATI